MKSVKFRAFFRIRAISYKFIEKVLDFLMRCDYNKQCARAGVIQEVRKREAYEKPSVKRKKKSEAARKRKFK